MKTTRIFSPLLICFFLLSCTVKNEPEQKKSPPVTDESTEQEITMWDTISIKEVEKLWKKLNWEQSSKRQLIAAEVWREVYNDDLRKVPVPFQVDISRLKYHLFAKTKYITKYEERRYELFQKANSINNFADYQDIRAQIELHVIAANDGELFDGPPPSSLPYYDGVWSDVRKLIKDDRKFVEIYRVVRNF